MFVQKINHKFSTALGNCDWQHTKPQPVNQRVLYWNTKKSDTHTQHTIVRWNAGTAVVLINSNLWTTLYKILHGPVNSNLWTTLYKILHGPEEFERWTHHSYLPLNATMMWIPQPPLGHS